MGFFISSILNHLVYFSCIVVILVGIFLTIKTKFIQFRMLPKMFKLLFSKKDFTKESSFPICSHQALFTSMSTTIGISSLVSPFIAISLGGPGAIIGFLISTFLGAAINYVEVFYSIAYRDDIGKKDFKAGPLSYLHKACHPIVAKFYAFFGTILLMTWSSAQSNQLASILNASYVFSCPKWITGFILAVTTTTILIGGAKWVGKISAKMVPIMFLLFIGSSFWIIFLNIGKLPAIFSLIWSSCLKPQTFATGATIGGLSSILRWGLMKGLQSAEAGVGTQTIPHSMSKTSDPAQQGILAMVSTYSSGFICILSGLIALITNTWLNKSLPLGIGMMAVSFQQYFSYFGLFLITFCALLFSFGTILGNNFNGCSCFSYLTKKRGLWIFYLLSGILTVIGSVLNVATIWSFIDFLILPVIIPHLLAILYLSLQKEKSSESLVTQKLIK